MYINFEYLEKKSVTIYEFLALQIISQKSYDLLVDMREILNSLYKKELVNSTKSINKEKPYLSVRLTTKGKRVLKEVTIANITDEVTSLSYELISLYESKGFNVGNKREVVKLLSWFMVNTEFSSGEILSATEQYLQGQTEVKFTRSLENFIHKSPSAFSSKWDLGNSMLYETLLK
jgi:DNA-binding MarR family transcriptional regulator